MSLRYRNVLIIGPKVPIITGAGNRHLECRLSSTGSGTFGKVPVTGTTLNFRRLTGTFREVPVTGNGTVELNGTRTGTGTFEKVPLTGTRT